MTAADGLKSCSWPQNSSRFRLLLSPEKCAIACAYFQEPAQVMMEKRRLTSRPSPRSFDNSCLRRTGCDLSSDVAAPQTIWSTPLGGLSNATRYCRAFQHQLWSICCRYSNFNLLAHDLRGGSQCLLRKSRGLDFGDFRALITCSSQLWLLS